METGMVGLLNLTGIEMGLILLAGCILLSLIIMIAYFRKVMALLKGPRPVYKDSDHIKEWVQESEAIYEKLLKALEERKEIANRLITQLDTRIETLRSMSIGIDRETVPIAEEIPGHQREGEVMMMAEEGRDFSEISKQTGLSVGEIQLIINLKRCQGSSPFKIA
ncbi:MAG: hypothetical protein FJ110_06410 [Deltaproteobacteria bacterium]|nr:hypothetical protein [Deltaproteobacteria bacterium]